MGRDIYLILVGAGIGLVFGVIAFVLQIVISQIVERQRLDAELSEQQMRERLIYSFLGIKISWASIIRFRNALIVGTFIFLLYLVVIFGNWR